MPLDAEEARAFLQKRIALFAKTIFAMCVGYYVGVGALHELAPDHRLTDWSIAAWDPFHLASCGVLAAVWIGCSFGKHSPRLLEIIDASGITAACTGYVLIGLSADPGVHIELTVLLGVTNTMLARAVMVPSTMGRSLWVGAAISVAVLIGTYAYHARAADPLPPVERGLFLGVAALWCAIAVSIAAIGSRVIYGLQQQVREAKQLGQYALERKLGEGGMGIVYQASHAMLRRPTAVKLLLPEKAGERNVERFEREVRLTALLTHPNTVTIFDYGRTPDGVFYYAMELLDGATLQVAVEVGGPMPAARVAHVLTMVAGALGEAHRVGLVHRDIKPSNIMLCDRGGIPDVPKVLDFGLVKDLAATGSESLTAADEITGTPQYMAPETITVPDRIDARSDIYSLGAVGYYLLTGEHVFAGRTAVEVCSRHLHETPVPPSVRLGKPIPAELEAFVLACLSKDPKDRPQTAAAVQEQLGSCEGIGAWDVEQARRWWEEYGDTCRLGPPDADHAEVAQVAMTVDLHHRAG